MLTAAIRTALPRSVVVRMFSTIERGTAQTDTYRMFFKNSNGDFVSPFHDIPLEAGKDTFNMIVEIPRYSNAKMEIATAEPLNPIKQDIKKGKLRNVPNCFPFKGYPWNYGAFPQTWENPSFLDERTNAKGDNDPVDVCEIGSQTLKRGQVVPVKVLGVLALIDDGETDWKIIVIKADDPLADKLTDHAKINQLMPGLFSHTRKWLEIYKIPDGKPANKFAFDGEFKSAEFAKEIIAETHKEWKLLINQSPEGSSPLALKNTSLEKYNVPAEEAAAIVAKQQEYKAASNPSDSEQLTCSYVPE